MIFSRIKALTLALAIVIASSTAASASQVRPLLGPIIMARSGAASLYLWNATSYVTQLVSDKIFDQQGLHALEETALSEMADRAKNNRSANTVSIKVFYAKTGAVNPAYGSATFVGMENVVTITAPRANLVRNSEAWISQISSGEVPSEVKIDITGKLPPRQ